MDEINSELREELSALQHDIWSHWMEYLFSVSKSSPDGSVVISKQNVERWKRQIQTAYKNLPESEKDSDRSQADKVIALLNEHLK